MIDFGKSRTIYTLRWPEVSERLRALSIADHYVGLGHRKQISQRADEVSDQLRSWLHPIIDLAALPHAYPTAGTHHAIEQWLASETRPVCCFSGEYPYPRHLRRDIEVVRTVTDIPAGSVVFMSQPFSATGMYDDRYLQISNPMVLDLAYVGTTGPHALPLLPNVEQVFWSASKAFGLGTYRTGYRYCRHADMLQDQIKDTGYYHWLGIEICQAAISTMHVTSAWQRMLNSYIELCRQGDLEPSHTYLIGRSHDDALLHLQREDGTIRVSTGRILEEMNGLG